MIVPTKTYYKVAVSLLVLFTLTVVIAYVDLGPWNIIVALIIATVKALFVVLYFMHVRYSSRVIWVFAIAGFFWLIILFTFTMSDYLTRS